VKGYIDLHCHYLPSVDDGVRSVADGVELLAGLHRIGFDRVVATPHIRTAMFENRAPALRAAYEALLATPAFRAAASSLPQTGLAAEHWCDDVFWSLFIAGESLPYPGGFAALIEFPPEQIPRGLEHRFFDMRRKGITPVIAHPERYTPLFGRTQPIEQLLDTGAIALLDLMSLTGRYGSAPKRAAERMLDEGAYYAACSDSHKPQDVELVADAIARLERLVGRDEARELLVDGPASILAGSIDA
jgi:protein-tyrosine phosphatase